MKNKKKIFSVTDNNILFDDSMSEKDQDKSSTANSKKEILIICLLGNFKIKNGETFKNNPDLKCIIL